MHREIGNVTNGHEWQRGLYRAVMVGCDDGCDHDGNKGDYIEADDE